MVTHRPRPTLRAADVAPLCSATRLTLAIRPPSAANSGNGYTMQTVAQHYVPRFLLKNFCTRAGKVYVYDIKTSTVRLQHPKKIAFANHMYTLDLKGTEPEALEKALAKVESKTAPLVRDLINGKQLSLLSQEERISLAVFIACQLPRVYKIRSYLESVKGVRQRISMDERGARIKITKGPNDPRLAHVTLIHYAAYNISPMILGMAWLLIRPADGETFTISDNPVTIYNTVEASRLVNLYEHLQTIYPPFRKIENIKNHLEGLLADPGVEICLPLSPTLAIFCVYPYLAEAADLPVNGTLTLEGNQSAYVNLLQGKASERYIYSADKPSKPQVPDDPDEIWNTVVTGLTQVFIEYNFVMQRVINMHKAESPEE